VTSQYSTGPLIAKCGCLIEKTVPDLVLQLIKK